MLYLKDKYKRCSCNTTNFIFFQAVIIILLLFNPKSVQFIALCGAKGFVRFLIHSKPSR